jgi:hypothetical protein
MMTALLSTFEVVNPRPPYPPSWPMADPNDDPVWAAAVAGRVCGLREHTSLPPAWSRWTGRVPAGCVFAGSRLSYAAAWGGADAQLMPTRRALKSRGRQLAQVLTWAGRSCWRRHVGQSSKQGTAGWRAPRLFGALLEGVVAMHVEMHAQSGVGLGATNALSSTSGRTIAPSYASLQAQSPCRQATWRDPASVGALAESSCTRLLATIVRDVHLIGAEGMTPIVERWNR